MFEFLNSHHHSQQPLFKKPINSPHQAGNHPTSSHPTPTLNVPNVNSLAQPKKISYSPSVIPQKRQVVSEKSLQILKQLLAESESKMSKYLTELAYIRRERSEHNVYNYATSVSVNQFVFGVMEIMQNYNHNPTTDSPKLQKKYSIQSIPQPAPKYNPFLKAVIITSYRVSKISLIPPLIHQQIKQPLTMSIESIERVKFQKIKASSKISKYLIKLKTHKKTYKIIQFNLKIKSITNFNSKNISPRTIIAIKNLHSLQPIYEIDDKLLKKDHDYFSAKHPKTKQVKEFIKKKKFNQQQLQLNNKQKSEKEKQKKLIQHQIFILEKQQMLSQRHAQLKQKYQSKKIQKIKQIKSQQQQRKIFKEWIKKYTEKKPLFIKKHQDYINNFVKIQQQLASKRLQQIKMERQPLDIQMLKEFEQKYTQQRNQNLIKKQQQFETMKQMLHKQLLQMRQNLHFGYYHQIILKQLQEIKQKNLQDPRKQGKQIRNRQKAYSINVKAFYPPKIDPIKREQSNNFIEQPKKHYLSKKRYDFINSNNEQGQRFSINSLPHNYDTNTEQPDSKKHGLRNLRILHQNIRQLRQNGLIKTEKKSKEQRNKSVTLEPRIDYLQDLKKQRNSKNKISQRVNQVQKFTNTTKDCHSLKIKAEYLDQKLKRKQKIIKNNFHSSNQEVEMQDQYLSAIKMKIKLLQNYD